CSVKNHVAGGYSSAAKNRELFLDLPRRPFVYWVPSCDEAHVPAGTSIKFCVGADVRRTGDIIRLGPFPIHAQICMRNIQKPGSGRISARFPIFSSRSIRTYVVNNLSGGSFLFSYVLQPASLKVDPGCRCDIHVW